MKIRSRLRLVCLLTVLLSTVGIPELFAETLVNEGKEIAQAHVKYHVGKVALIPFTSKEKLSYEQVDESINQIERYLTVSLYDALVAETVGIPDVVLLPLEKSNTEYLKFRSGKPKIYFRDIAIDVGRILDADSVMIGTISEYTERSGSEWAIESPTTISFSVEVLSTKDGKKIWETTFTETQQPLFDNLFEIKKFVKRKGKWITADEMAKEGARKIAQRFSRFVLENR
jgi:hypothetical protein